MIKTVHTFVVRTDHIQYEVQSTKGLKQETGETNGCKSRDLSELRFGSVRRDLPLFFNKYHIIMRTENGLCNCTKCSTNELIDDLIGHNDWVENVPGIKNTIQKLLLAYIRSEEIDGTPVSARADIAFHISIVNFVLDKLLEFEKNRCATEAA